MARFIGVDLASAWCEAETRRLDSTGIRMWATRVLRMAVRKTSTGIVGLPVNPNARQDLIAIYQKTLREVQALPDGIAYRNAVEQITSYRLKVVQENEDEDVIEKTINCGQLEELIEQAEDELSIFPVYLEHKLWEPPVKSA